MPNLPATSKRDGSKTILTTASTKMAGSVMGEIVRRIRENFEAHAIYTDGRLPLDPAQELHRAAYTGNLRGRWVDANLIPRLEREARLKAKREAEELQPIPEPEFDREDGF